MQEAPSILTPVHEALPDWLQSIRPDSPGVFSIQGVSGVGKSEGIKRLAEKLAQQGVRVVPDGFAYVSAKQPLLISGPAGSLAPNAPALDGWTFDQGLQPGNDFETIRRGMLERRVPTALAAQIAEVTCSYGFGSWDLAHRLAETAKGLPESQREQAFLRAAERFLHQQVLPVFWQNSSLQPKDLAPFSALENPQPQIELLEKLRAKYPRPQLSDLTQLEIPGFNSSTGLRDRYTQLFRELPSEPTIIITANNLTRENRIQLTSSITEQHARLHKMQRSDGEPELGNLPQRRHYLLYWQPHQSLESHPTPLSPNSSRLRFCQTPEFIALRTERTASREVLQFAQAHHFPYGEFVMRSAIVEGALQQLGLPYSVTWPQRDGAPQMLYPHALHHWSSENGFKRASAAEEARIFFPR